MENVVERAIANPWDGVRRGGHRLTSAQLKAGRGAVSWVGPESHVPAGLPVGPLPGSAELARLMGSNGAAVDLAAPAPSTGTPGDPNLFTSWPWSAVGKVLVGHTAPDGTRVEDKSGTGVMVGRWVMLTAGHVLPWKYSASGNWWIEFYPAFYGHSSKFGSALVHTWWGTEDKTPDNNDVGDIGGIDYAVCGLTQPLGDRCGWVSCTHLKEARYDDFIYTSTGYPGNVDNGDTPCIETGLHILDIDNAGDGIELETRRYPVAGGWSGGPLWSNIDGDLRVVAVATSPQKDFGFDPTRVMHSGGGLMLDIIRHGLVHFGAGPMTASGDPFGYKGPAPHHVVYRSTVGDIVELFINGKGQWAHNVISAAAGAPKASGSPRSYITAGKGHHVVYRSGESIVELFINSAGNWNFNILTNSAKAPAAASDPFGYVGPAPQHVVYRSTGGDIIELFIDSTGNWAYTVVTAAAGAPKAAGAPRAYITAGNGHHIVYRSKTNQIVELFINFAGNWNFNILTNSAGAPAAASDPFGYAGPAPKHVVYRLTGGDIIELFIDSTGHWAYTVVNAAAGAPKAADGAPRSYITAGNGHHIVYRSLDSRVVELYINSAGNWNFNILTDATRAPLAAGDPFGYVGPAPQHVVYRSPEGEVVELFIDGTGNWAHNLITARP